MSRQADCFAGTEYCLPGGTTLFEPDMTFASHSFFALIFHSHIKQRAKKGSTCYNICIAQGKAAV
jgi:hypothetical protein